MVTFGGARSITQKYFAKATNYYARNDPILLVNRRAMNLMQQVGKIGRMDGRVFHRTLTASITHHPLMYFIL